MNAIAQAYHGEIYKGGVGGTKINLKKSGMGVKMFELCVGVMLTSADSCPRKL